jgi:large subunit ribosomal protein L15
MPLVRRVPKRGFTNIWKIEYTVINVGALAEVEAGEGGVTPELLSELGLVRRRLPVKVLGGGEVARPLKVAAHRFSKSAREKIESAGGECLIVGASTAEERKR